MTAPLVSIVGPVADEVLRSFLDHYTSLGFNRVLIGLHLPGASAASEPRLRDVLREFHQEPALVNHGPWDESANRVSRDYIRARDPGSEWHFFADVDEYHQYPCDVAELLELAQAQQASAIGGLLVDRVAADGTPLSWPVDGRIDECFPLGTMLTSRVAQGDPRKVIGARRDASVEDGQHWSKDAQMMMAVSGSEMVVLVHHFKWHSGVLAYLVERSERFESGEWREETSAMREEGERVVGLFKHNDGRIDVLNPLLDCAPINLKSVVPEWVSKAEREYDEWTVRLSSGWRPDPHATIVRPGH